MNELSVSEHLRANYDNYYDNDQDLEWRRLGALQKADNIVSLCQDLPHHSVLEIGSGEGSVLKQLSHLKFGNQLYGLEISPSGVASIHRKQIPQLLECQLFDGYEIPYESNQFDIAILSHVIEHVEHPRQLLYQAARVARYVFVEVPLEDTCRLPWNFVDDKVGHLNFYSPKTIRQLVQSCHLQVLRQISTNPPRQVYTYRNKGIKGWLHYQIKQTLLDVLPQQAPHFFTYHGALVCTKHPAAPS